MSTIEKLFVQIFDRKRQIIQQLNHQKQLYDQHLASKLLIQGITPPPWLLNPDKFASSSAFSSDPKDLVKEELISGLLLYPQPLPAYSNATHHHVPESPQERVVSDIYADPDESLARMQRSKSRQKALEIRSSGKETVESQLEDKLPTGPRKDMLQVGSATASGGILSSSKDGSILKEQGVSSKEEGDLKSPTKKADASTNLLSPHSVCRDLSLEESRLAADSVAGKDKLDANSLGMQNIELGGCASGSVSALGLSNLLASQVANLLPVELIIQDDVVSSQRMQFILQDDVVSSKKNELQRDMYSGGTKCATQPSAVQESKVPAEIETTHALSNEIADQVVNLFPREHSCQMQDEQPTSVPSEGMELVIGSSGNKNLQKREREQSPVEIESIQRLSAVEVVKMSPEDIHQLLAGQPASVHSEMVTLATTFSGKNKLEGGRYLWNDSLDNVSPGHLKRSAGHNIVETASAQAFSRVISRKFEGLTPEEDFPHLEVEEPKSLSSKWVKHATDSSGEHAVLGKRLEEGALVGIKALKPSAAKLTNELDLDHCVGLYSGENSRASMGECNKEVRFSPCRETAEWQGATANEMATNELVLDQSVKLSSAKLANDLELDRYIGLYSWENSRESQGRCEASTDECDTEVRFSPYQKTGECSGSTANEMDINELDLDHYIGVYSGENSRESQGICEASTDKCNTEVRLSPSREIAECSRAIANELATCNSEDKMKLSAKQKSKLDDIQSQAAELQANCFSKEAKFSAPSKLLELQTLWTECSPTSADAGGSWPRQKRRKIESISSKSASPNLQVNQKNIFSHGMYVDNSRISDFSARKITQNVISSSSSLSEHSSAMLHKEEKLSFQGSSNVDPERLQISSVSSLAQQSFATSPHCLHKADLTREKSNFSFSVSKVDTDPVDNKICCEKNSLEVNNLIECSGGSPFVEHKEVVGAEGGISDLESFTFVKTWENSKNIKDSDVINMADKVDVTEDILNFSTKAWCLQKSPQNVEYFDCLGDSPLEHQDLVGGSVSVADLEGFTFKRKCDDTQYTGDLEGLISIDLPKNTIDRARFLERLCRSASLGVPLSHFQASYSSDRKMNICHSVPIGVLDHTDFRNTSALDPIDGQQLKSSHTCTERVENSELQGNAFDDYSPIHGTQFAWDFKGPYISPVSKAIEGLSAKSRGSSKRGSSNPELTCFPIEESGEEDEIANDVDHNCPEETSSVRRSVSSASEEYMNAVALDPNSNMVTLGSVSTESSISASDKKRGSDPEFTCFPVEERSEQDVNVVVPQSCKKKSGSARQPLCDISKNVTALVLHPSPKRSTESFRRASSTSEVNKKISGSSQAHSHQGEILKKKKNQNVAGIKKLYDLRDSRFSKPKVSGKSSLETRGGSFSEKEPKPNNIVSNIKSFVPLVQKNQEAPRAPVKKEIVKSLQAAVAAKQREEKKEIERKRRKEAQELERARREQENLRQIELQKKAKEEERKKKDAKIADRKRQREEEEERKEKERKRKRVGEARKQIKGHDDKLSVDKEKRSTHAEDGKTDGRKEANTGREDTMGGGQEVKNVAITSSVLPIASGDLNVNGLGMSSNPCKKDKDVSVVGGCSTPIPDGNYSSTIQTCHDKSYDISPYCCSDEEEEDEIPNNKFIPAWASRSSVTKALASLSNLDPEVIFPPSSFCSLNEVFLPQQLRQR